MITRVQIKHFRNLADVDVHLGPLTVLVGRNGAGKSNFLDALRFVRDALTDGVNTAIYKRGGIEAIRHRSLQTPPDDIEIALEVTTPDGKARYTFTVGTEQQEYRRVKAEALQYESKINAVSEIEFETKDGKWITYPTDAFVTQKRMSTLIIPPDTLMLPTLSNFFYLDLEPVLSSITATTCYRVFPNTLKLPQKQTSFSLLSEDGQNFATTLQSIISDEEFLPDLISALARITQGIQDINVMEWGGYLVVNLKKVQGLGSLSFPIDQESDGTLRVLALLVALYQKAPNHLIAVEEPELSIHPGALAVLSEVIEEAATRSQVIITTQSPDLISRFGVDQLRVVEMVDGNTHIGPIEEGQREAINEQLFSAGDLLRIEGLHVSRDESASVHA